MRSSAVSFTTEVQKSRQMAGGWATTRILVTLEELLEDMGVAVFISTLASHMKSQPDLDRVSFELT